MVDDDIQEVNTVIKQEPANINLTTAVETNYKEPSSNQIASMDETYEGGYDEYENYEVTGYHDETYGVQESVGDFDKGKT